MCPIFHPTVMGIDPGVSTGIALATINLDTSQYMYITATCSEPEQVWEYVTSAVQVVVIERFSASLISKYGLHTVEVVGGVKALCWKLGISIVCDTPAQRKPYLAMARSLVPKGENHTIHEVDALSHVVRYLYQKGYIKSLRYSNDDGARPY